MMDDNPFQQRNIRLLRFSSIAISAPTELLVAFRSQPIIISQVATLKIK